MALLAIWLIVTGLAPVVSVTIPVELVPTGGKGPWGSSDAGYS
jgi:hypothetical protein